MEDMTCKYRSPLKESTKEFFRVVVLAVLPVLIYSIEKGVSWDIVRVTLAVAVLRAIDRYLHQRYKNVPETKLKSLTQF